MKRYLSFLAPGLMRDDKYRDAASPDKSNGRDGHEGNMLEQPTFDSERRAA